MSGSYMIGRGAEDIEVLLLFAIPLKRRVLVKSRGLCGNMEIQKRKEKQVGGLYI